MSIEKYKKRIEQFENVKWSHADAERAVSRLKSKFPKAQFSVEAIMEMGDLLGEEYGNDPGQIEKTILTHMRRLYPVVAQPYSHNDLSGGE